MWAVCKKELRQFFSSLTGYIAIIVFLLLNGLMLFVFPDTDILTFGYATLDKFFELAPWILLLLIPAITMRSLSEEFRMGTFEILQTTPLTKTRLLAGKYLACLIVMLIALLPTLIYYISIQQLSGQGGIDTGATSGSYIGLVFLAAVFTAVGIWCSSFTSNAVVAFITAAFACFLLYSGFGAISVLPAFSGGADYYMEMLGIDFHYRSISRGVIDTRDVIYFCSLIFLFLYLANRQLDRKSKVGAAGAKGWRMRHARALIVLLLVLGAVNWLAARKHYRLDLTAEKRFTLSAPTRNLLARIDEDVEVDFFLEGDLKSGIRKLSKSAQELLQEFNEYSDGRIHVHAFDPLLNRDDSSKSFFLDSLRRLGLEAMTQVAQSKKGEEQSQRLLIPGAIIRYKERILPVSLLKGVQVGKDGQPEEQLYTNAETLLEYKFGSALDRITKEKIPVVGYVMGNGEPLDYHVYSLIQGLRGSYHFGIVPLDSVTVIPEKYNALIIVKPTKKFTDREKLSLDQYLLHGGQLIWAIDNLYAEMDSLTLNRQTIAYDRGLELEDLFFRYGVRVNPDLVEDLQCIRLNMVVGTQGNKPQMQLIPWPYFPLLNGSLTHPISKNLDPVYSKFANSLEMVNSPGIAKAVLLQTSDNARTVSTPALVSLESVKQASETGAFNKANIPVAMLLEGKFRSLYANRVSTAMTDSLANFYHQPFIAEGSVPSRVIVCADADIVMNDVTPEGQPMPMGFSKDNNYPFANQDFIDNCFEYLLNPNGVLETRAKDYTLRLLDPAKIEKDRPFWQFANIGLPFLLVVFGGYIYQFLRKRRYAKKYPA